MSGPLLQTLEGRRYVSPLREGGSLPAIVETDDGTFVVKFLGAGQGHKALIAETLAAGLASQLELPIPRAALIELGDGFGKNEPDPEIQDILRNSLGLNFGLAYLPGALGYDPAVDQIDPDLAAEIVWFDAWITNVDRTARNPNLLNWRGKIWMIDHGVSLYIHFQWQGWRERLQSRFPQIKDHILLHLAADLREADARMQARVTPDVIERAVVSVPDVWLGDEEEFGSIEDHRAGYVTYLTERLRGDRPWLDEAVVARQRGPEGYAERITRRVV